ncbi:MAG: transcriptional regulator [Hyphococcus sp.]|nr:MAG: transcriptional regulator [Marinicaulis sp.]
MLVMANGSKFEALAVPTRRVVFEKLRAGPMSVGDLAAGLPVTRPAVSQHLKILKHAGLVAEHREGVKRIYRLDAEGIAEIRDYFDRFWDGALDAYKRSLEAKDA